MAVDFTQGYAARWRVDMIDAATWESRGVLGGVESAEVDRDCTDAAPMLETATMAATLPASAPFAPGWYRIVMEAEQGTHSQAVPIATLWFEAAGGTYDKGYRTDDLQGRSVLWQAAEPPIGDGMYAPKGADGALWCAERLRSCIDAPVSVSGGFEVAENVVFDLGASVLEAVWAVLKDNGWCMQVDGRGEVAIIPLPAKPALSIDREGAAIMQPQVSYRDGSLSYVREYAEGVYPLSLVYGAVPERGLDGTYRVQTQKLTCGRGITIEESVTWA